MTEPPASENGLKRLLHQAYLALMRMNWTTLGLLFGVHFLGTWVLMALAGESALAAPRSYFWFYVVTLSTVGYGDLAPQGLAGRLVATVWLIPGGLVLFTTILAKTVDAVGELLRRRMKGESDYADLRNHVVVVGVREGLSGPLLDNLLADRGERPVVLVTARDDMDNPRPDQLLFVRGPQLSDHTTLQRAGVANAERVAILGGNDHEALHVALVTGRMTQNPNVHMVAFFENPETAALLEQYNDKVETVISSRAGIVARALLDPGSSLLHARLTSPLEGQTQYSVKVPATVTGLTFGGLVHHFKTAHQAILLALASNSRGTDLRINPPGDQPVAPGTILFYVSARRLRAEVIDWQAAENHAP